MPIFEFKCPKCSHELEVLLFPGELQQDISYVCPTCTEQMEKQVSAPKGYVVGTQNPVKQ